MELSLKKYLMSAAKLLALFLFIGILCLVVCFVDTIDTGIFLALVIPVSCIFLLFPAGYYCWIFFVFNKKSKNIAPVEGVVTNWEAGFFYRGTGGIIVNVDGKEYATSAYFSCDECKQLVGKTVSYAIIDETLFVYEIKD